MKTWTMPRVAVEAFRANEYVAGSCYDTFTTNEAQIYAIMDSARCQIDFDGSTSGWGATDYNNRPPYPGSYTRGQSMSQWQWDNWPHSGAYTGWVELSTESTDQAKQYQEQGLILDYATSGRIVWGKVYVYWVASNTGTDHWHPSNLVESSANHS